MRARREYIRDPHPGKRKLINQLLKDVDLRPGEEVIDLWEAVFTCGVQDEEGRGGVSGMWTADYILATNRRLIVFTSDVRERVFNRGKGETGLHAYWLFKKKTSIPFEEIQDLRITKGENVDTLEIASDNRKIDIFTPRSIRRDGQFGSAEVEDIHKVISDNTALSI
jgi:hypothetical protein